MDPLIGRKLSRYRIARKIGEGGMGSVYHARDTRLDRDVALKVLSAGTLRDRASRTRLLREARHLSHLNHPNIATLYDFDTDEGIDFLVMELIHGTNLAEKLRACPMPGVQALALGIQIAQALEFAHDRGLIHRDLKPRNVMVTADGGAKLLDFGIALRSAGPLRNASGPTATRRPGRGRQGARASIGGTQVMGTPGYMSPEQIQGLTQDHRTDTFAFGCVLFECLAGERAFVGETAEEVLAAVLTGEPRWSALPEGVPPGIRALLVRCLEKDPDRRLPAMREVRKELEATLGTRHHASYPRALISRAAQGARAAHNLPKTLTSLVGREAEIAECLGLLRRTRLLTLTGHAGHGKTRLCLQVAERLVPDFPDGTWFVDLGPLQEGSRVAQAVASAAGVRADPQIEPLDALQKSLRGKRTLLVFDNCERHLGPCSEIALAVLRACPHVTVLATSREALRVTGEHVLVVTPLRVPTADDTPRTATMAAIDSVRLFSERARDADPRFELTEKNVRPVAEICRRLDGIPLAIELAASFVKSMSPDEILSRLGSRFDLLASGGADGGGADGGGVVGGAADGGGVVGGAAEGARPGRETLREAIDWSYEQLMPEERSLFSALSVFAGGWTLESASSVCGGQDEFAVLDRFTRLLDKSLVVDTTGDGMPRYRFLETIREYASEKLETSDDRDSVAERHLEYFLALAEEAAPKLTGPQQASWLSRLDAEHENLRAATRYCENSERHRAKALRFTAALWRFWMARGRLQEGRLAIDAALRMDAGRSLATTDAGRSLATTNAGRSLARAETLAGGGALAFHLTDWALGRAYCEESLAIFGEARHSLGVADASVALGNITLGEGDYGTARSLYDRAFEKYREADQRRGMGVALSNSGRAAELQGDLAAASRLYEDGLQFLREVGDLSSVALRLSSLGQLLLRSGNLAAARERLHECLILALELKERRAGPFALERSAALLEELGAHRDAALLCAAADELRQAIGSPLTPREGAERDALLARIRDSMGGRFDAAWTAGGALNFESALKRALACLNRASPEAGRVPGSGRVPAPAGTSRKKPPHATLGADLESTGALLDQIRGGSAGATARLVKRYLPILRRWAHGRLPRRARDLSDTDDLVQVALLRGLARLESFEQRKTGAFFAYMRQIVRNQIRDEIRRPASRTEVVELPDELPDERPSPLEEAIGRESLERYEAALAGLPAKQRESIVMRLEMGFSYREIADALGSPSEEAVRKSVTRGLEVLKRRIPGNPE